MNNDKTISAFASMTDDTTMVIQRWLPGPAERVWRYLTVSELRRKWLADGIMELKAGSPLELIWRNDCLSAAHDLRPLGFAAEQRMHSCVVAVDPMRELTIAWGNGAVTFTLEEKGDRVLLTISHSGLETRDETLNVAAGWHVHSDILVAELSAKHKPSFWSNWTKLCTAYGHRLSH